jgi:AraC family transcriptional regulator
MHLEPTFVNLDPFLLAGCERFTDNGMQSLLDTWSDFSKIYASIPHKADPPIVWAYEDYSRGFEQRPNEFPRYYFSVGVEVTSLDGLPEGVIGKRASGGEYARFDYTGVLDRLNEVFRFIYDEWIPNSAYVFDQARGADLVRYPQRAENDFGTVNVFIPLVRK